MATKYCYFPFLGIKQLRKGFQKSFNTIDTHDYYYYEYCFFFFNGPFSKLVYPILEKNVFVGLQPNAALNVFSRSLPPSQY